MLDYVSSSDTDDGCATFSQPPPPPGNVTQVVVIEAVIDLPTAGAAGTPFRVAVVPPDATV